MKKLLKVPCAAINIGDENQIESTAALKFYFFLKPI
jgi:hypothetical protein